MTKNIIEDCPDWRQDPILTVKQILDLGYLEGDCYPCMYYDPISKSCVKDEESFRKWHMKVIKKDELTHIFNEGKTHAEEVKKNDEM